MYFCAKNVSLEIVTTLSNQRQIIQILHKRGKSKNEKTSENEEMRKNEGKRVKMKKMRKSD